MASFADADTLEDLFDPELLTGWSDTPRGGSGSLTTGLHAGTRNGEHPPLWSPENPLFWFGALLAFASGLIYVSTTVKAGKLHGKVDL